MDPSEIPSSPQHPVPVEDRQNQSTHFEGQALVAQMGCEVASALSSALERVATLAASGRIDRADLRALREEIELARSVGIMGQQLVRLSRGHVQIARERLDLTALLRDALHMRQRESKTRGFDVRPLLTEVGVMSDATLVFSLIETLLDWSFEHARSRIVLRLDAKSHPERARLSCAFLRRRPTAGGRVAAAFDGEDPALNTLAWRLLQQTAEVLGLRLRRRDTGDRCEMRLSFPDAIRASVAEVDGMEAEDVSAQAYNSQPLSGRHVVVMAARREVRSQVRDALRPMGLMIDFVASVDEAQQLFADALPHAVVFEAAMGGDRFDRLRSDMLAEVPSLAFIQIAETGKAFEVLEAGGHPLASVARDSLSESLPAALLFELSRHG